MSWSFPQNTLSSRDQKSASAATSMSAPSWTHFGVSGRPMRVRKCPMETRRLECRDCRDVSSSLVFGHFPPHQTWRGNPEGHEDRNQPPGLSKTLGPGQLGEVPIKVLLSSERNGETSTSKAGVQGPHKQLKITGGTLFVIFLSRHSEHRSDMVRQHFVSGCSERKTDSRFSRQAPTFKHPKLFFVSQKNIDSYFRGKGVHGFTAPPLQANDMMSNLCHQTTRFPSEHTFFGQAGRCLLKGFLVFKN